MATPIHLNEAQLAENNQMPYLMAYQESYNILIGFPQEKGNFYGICSPNEAECAIIAVSYSKHDE